MYTAAVYAEHARARQAKKRLVLGRRFPAFNSVSAFARLQELSRSAYADLKKYWESYRD